jgi:hypothetical protein
MSDKRPFYVPVVSSFYVPANDSSRYWFGNEKTIQFGNVIENEIRVVEDDDNLEYFNEGDREEIVEVNNQIEDDAVNGNEEEDDEQEIFIEVDNIDELFMDGYLINIQSNLNSPFNGADKLYDGCEYSLKEFCRYLLCLKNAIMVGDVAFCCIVGAVLSFIPLENRFTQSLGVDSSVYEHLKVINYFADFDSSLQTFKFNICDNQSCIIKKDGSFCCDHEKKRKKYFYYMPIRQRVEYLLKSDLRNFFLYPLHKYRSPKVINYYFFMILIYEFNY